MVHGFKGLRNKHASGFSVFLDPWNPRLLEPFQITFQVANTNALNFITSVGIAPHPIPLPSGERGG